MKSMSMRSTILWCVALGLLAFGAFAFWGNVRRVETEQKEAESRLTEERLRYDGTVGKVLAMAKDAVTLGEWEAVRVEAQNLPEPAKGHLTLLTQVRTMELLADERDRLLANAGALLTANENDPAAKENIAKALVFQERADALVQKIESIPGNGQWNKSLQYRKAYEKYRSLAFVPKDEHGKALDVIDDAVRNLVKGLDAAPKDNRTELAIEFLYKRAKEEEEKSSANGDGPGRPRALPPPERGPDGPGTGGRNRPRLH